ncbi:cupin [Streptomyces vilmorinianum]|uniref:cupin n=1 Tax=Streptomyces vilmorinianum TaxID=3051092 RepID=UPI0010FBB5C7|nr:cupin [Streptomyces vilmorinianum]
MADLKRCQEGAFGVGISAQSAGAERLCLHRLVMPAGTRGRPHLHEGHESATFVQSDQVEVWHGQDLAEDMVCLVARTDPDEQEGVRLLELPVRLASRVGPLPVGAG